MIALTCDCTNYKKNGRDRNKNQRFKCRDCNRTWIEERVKPIGDMRISFDKAVLAINLLVEGNSIRACERIAKLHRDTICDLVLTVGGNCGRMLSRIVKDVPVSDIQCDEIWSWVGCKERTKKARGYTSDAIGDCWTFIALERKTKLVLAFHVGKRDQAKEFLQKLRKAVTGKFQISTDGWGGYTNNVPYVFRYDADFGQLIKTYSKEQSEIRYSPARIISAEKKPVWGSPDHDRICTSHIERLNLSLRMNMRRFTRLTNGFSKSWAHHEAMQNIFFAWYNFSRVHASLDKKTPAMESGLAESAWSIEQLLTMASSV